MLLLPILHNPVSCGADGLLSDTHDAADGLVVHAHFVEDEEEGGRKSQHMRTTSPIAVGSGFYFGYCIMTIFTFRFFVEFLKKEQVDFEQDMLLDMGQLLSIPFVLVGLWCMIKK